MTQNDRGNAEKVALIFKELLSGLILLPEDRIRYNFLGIDIIREGNPHREVLADSDAVCCKVISFPEFEKAAIIIAADQDMKIKPLTENSVGCHTAYEFY